MTREFLISEIQRWASEHEGRPPRYADWNSAHCRVKLGREREPGWPSTMAVQNHFGSWTAGLAAAGFTTAPGAPVRTCPDCGRGARRAERCARCHAFLERWGVPWSREGAHRVPASRQFRNAWDRLERILDLRRQGLLNHEIASELGMPKQSVANWITKARRLGYEVPPTTYGPVAARESRVATG